MAAGLVVEVDRYYTVLCSVKELKAQFLWALCKDIMPLQDRGRWKKKQQQSVIYLNRDRAIFCQMLEQFQRRRYLGNEEIG